MTAKPTASLSTSGTDPKLTTKAILEAEIQRHTDANWQHAIDLVTGLTGTDAATVYSSTSAGIAATSSGAIFRTVSAEDDGLFDYWLNEAEVAVSIGTGLSLSAATRLLEETVAARDAAQADAKVYTSTAAGLAAVSEGGQFMVVVGDEIIRYEDVSGVATERARYPTARAATDATARINAERVNYALEDEPAGLAVVFANVGARMRVKASDPNLQYLGAITPKISITSSANACFFDEAGFLKRGATNTPRIGWTRYPILGEPGLIVEDQRTNNALHSRDLTQAAWVKTGASAALDQIGLDGVANSASSVLATSANATVLQSITQVSAARVLSAYVRRLVGTGAVEMTQDGGTNWTPLTLSNGWALQQIAQTLANPSFGFRLATSGDKIAVDLVQNEVGDHVSSPIITTTGGLARAADMPSIALSALPFQSGEGTIYIESLSDRPVGQVRYVFQLDDNSDANRIYAVAFNTLLARVFAASADQVNVGAGSADASVSQRVAMSWAANDVRIAASGLLGADTSATIPGGLTQLRLGSGRVAGSNLFGRITRLVYLPKASVSDDLLTWSANGYAFSPSDVLQVSGAEDLANESDRITSSARWRGIAALSDRTRRDDAEAGLTYFADSVQGSNANNGTVRARAKQTIAGLLALNPSAGESLGLANGSYWRERITPSTNLRRIMGYGANGLAVLDGADIIPPVDFSLSAHGDAGGVVYEVNLSGDVTDAVGNNDSIMIWENGDWLIRRTSVAAVAATPGSFYLPSPYISNSNPATLRLAYVHPFGSTNPTSDGKTYEASKRSYCINLGDRDKVTVEGVHVKRGASEYGPIGASNGARSPVLRRVLSSYGGKHNMVFADGTFEDVVCFDAEIDRLALADGGLIPFTFYATDATGLKVHMRRGMGVFPDDRPTSIGPLYAHSSADPAKLHTELRVEGFITYNCGGISANVKNLILDDFVYLGPGYALQMHDQTESTTLRRAMMRDTRSSVGSGFVEKNATYAADLTITDTCILSQIGSGGSPAAFYPVDIASAADARIERNCFWRSGPYGGNLRLDAAAAGSSVRGNIFLVNQGGSSRYVRLGSGLDVDYNVYINFDGASGKFWGLGATTYSSLAAWRAATGYDTNSVLLNNVQAAQLFLGDPTQGDFRLNPDCALTFADGTPIIGNCGPREYYDWNARAVTQGQPRRWLTPPKTEAECEAYVSDPFIWDFYPLAA